MVLQLYKDSLQCAKSNVKCRLVNVASCSVRILFFRQVKWLSLVRAFHLQIKREVSGGPEREKDEFLCVFVYVHMHTCLRAYVPCP